MSTGQQVATLASSVATFRDLGGIALAEAPDGSLGAGEAGPPGAGGSREGCGADGAAGVAGFAGTIGCCVGGAGANCAGDLDDCQGF